MDNTTIQNKKKGAAALSIIPDALKYYDDNNNRFQKIRHRIKYFEKVSRTTDEDHDKENTFKTDHVVYSFYDKNKELLFTSRVERIGKYYVDQSIWIWAWALPNINKSASTTIRNVFLYGTDINVINAGKLNYENLLLKNELITSRSIITDPIQVEIHCALASYLAKRPMVLPFADVEIQSPHYPLIPFTDYSLGPEALLEKEERADTLSDDKFIGHIVYYLYILDPPGA